LTPELASTKDEFYNLLPVFWAVSYNASAEVLELLLNAYPAAIEERHPRGGWTLLHYAERLDEAAVRLLLELGPDAASTKDTNGALPLHWIAEHNADVQVSALVLAANPKALEVEDLRGFRPLALAVQNEASEELVGLLTTGKLPGTLTSSANAADDGASKFSAASALPAPSGPPRSDYLPVALLFSGEGSEAVGMLGEVKELPEVQKLLADAASALEFDVLQLCLSGPEESLKQPKHCVPALYVAGLAAFEGLRNRQPSVAERFGQATGFGVGELTAMTVGGVLSVDDGLLLAKALGEALQEATNSRPQATLSVVGLEDAKLATVCQQAQEAAGDGEICEISGYLFHKGHTVGGSKIAIEKCQALAKKAKALQARPQAHSYAAHTTLMAPAKEKFEGIMREVLSRSRRPTCRLYLSGSESPFDWDSDPAAVGEAFLSHISSPTRWKDMVKQILADGVQDLWELGAGSQLKAGLKRIDQPAWSRMQSVVA